MTISVVIPAFNEERLLGETLERVTTAVKAFSDRGWYTEIVVCDNNSTDRTAEIASQAGAKVVFEPVNQIGRARNSGASAALGDWLVFIDADTHPSYELLAVVADQIAAGQCLAGGSTVFMPCEEAAANWLIQQWNNLSRGCRLMAGSFIFCETDAFRAVGGFDKKLFVGEEIDLSWKLKRLARKRKRRVVILDQHPVCTSARKLRLYKKRDYFWFLLKNLFTLGRAKYWRSACGPWYDGRR